MKWYARNIGDYLGQTMSLTLEEDGAYSRMLDIYYATEAPLPLNDMQMHLICRCKTDAQCAVADRVLKKYFVQMHDGWHNLVADKEIEKARKISQKRRNAANTRHDKERARRDASAMQTGMQVHIQTHTQLYTEGTVVTKDKDVTPVPSALVTASRGTTSTSTTKPKPNGGVSAREHTPAPAPAREAAAALTWDAYADAYFARYQVAPVRNAKVNAMIAQLVQRLGHDEAPRVAAFFVSSNRGLYVSSQHAVNLLVRDAESLRTQWAKRRAVTDTEGRQADRTQAIGNVFLELIEEARNDANGKG